MWALFIAIIITLLVIDLGVLRNKEKEISIKESLISSFFYIMAGLLFGAWIWYNNGAESGKEYLTGFAIEKTLSLDNIFVISLIFRYLAIDKIYRYRVLFWGILCAVIFRAIMIALGTAVIAQFEWVLHLFSIFLIITGIKMLFMINKSPNMQNNLILKFMRKHIRITNELHDSKFLVWLPATQPGKKLLYCTPLFVALVLIEVIDLIFAVDSIPAIFTITIDPFIVYTSNIFAILGLRALYFAIEGIIDKFKYLKYSLAMVLIFIGSKTFIADLLGLEKFPISISMGVTFGLIIIGIIYSLCHRSREQ